MRTIVFDFDKTLTYKDSLTQLFMTQMKGWRVIYLPYFVILKVLSKIKVISVLREKELLMNALFPRSEKDLQRLFLDFVPTIVLSPVNNILKEYNAEGSRVIVLTASPEKYLKLLFPKCEVIGMRFSYGKGFQITQHPYGKEKLKCLLDRGVNLVDEMFYDSKSDEALIPLCKKWNRVKDGVIIETNNTEI